MKVLVACEESQAVCTAFRNAPEDFYCWYPLQEPPEEFFK